eukprot:7225831-Prymnesium_polylepis.2
MRKYRARTTPLGDDYAERLRCTIDSYTNEAVRGRNCPCGNANTRRAEIRNPHHHARQPLPPARRWVARTPSTESAQERTDGVV